MHTLLVLLSLLLAVAGGYAMVAALPSLHAWRDRRRLALLVLATPLLSLVVGLGALLHLAGRPCWLGAPTWDTALGAALPLGMAVAAVGGLVLGLGRHALVARLVARRGVPADPALQALADTLAERLDAPRALVRVCALDRPLALTCGLRQPAILLSDWMLERLDATEREAVLAHELAHVARRDYLIAWLSTFLRDAFWYLPTSRVAHRLIRREQEPACDDRAAAATRRPLALASALAKVWQPALVTGSALTPALTGAGDPIERRIERLLTGTDDVERGKRVWRTGAVVGLGLAVPLVALQTASVTALLAHMGCGPLV